MKRREFLKQSALAAAYTLSARHARALTQDRLERKGAPKRIIVVGAGLAGLSAAYELTEAGHGAPVVGIEQDARAVRVAYLQGGVRESLAADRLVCAVPFSTLRLVNVSPQFSAGKRQAIEQLPYTSVVRTYFQTRRKFWLDEGLSGSATTDLANLLVFDGAPNQTAARGILEAYAAGPEARRVTALGEVARINSALAQVEKVQPRLRRNFEAGVTKCWDADEWARGAYAWYKPGQMTTLLPHVARPEGRVHFAGEHTSSLFGWMQGALESGNRAAREVNDAP